MHSPMPIRLDGVSEADQVKLIPHSSIQMLGVPLGNDLFVSDFVEPKLLGRLQSTVNKLVDFEDTGRNISFESEFQHSARSSFYAHHAT